MFTKVFGNKIKGAIMKKIYIIKIVIILIIFSINFSLAQYRINLVDNPAAGYIRATWYNSPAFFLIDNNGKRVYENDNIKLKNYLKYLGKNRWAQVVGETYYIYDENMNVIDSVVNPYLGNMDRMIDWHDVTQLSNGHYLLLLFDSRTMDLSQVVEGGQPDAVVVGNMLVETDRTGKIYWEWSVFDQFDITDITDYYDLTFSVIDFTHINSVQETPDGNIVLSVRNFDEVVKIKKSDGSIMWRIGGSKSKKNQFTFVNDDMNGFFGFSHQHSAFILPNGNLILLDNGWLNPLQKTRGVEYQLDLENKTATKVWEYFHPTGVFAGTMGSIEVLPNGNRFVNFGRKFITEVRPDGSVAWELEYFDGNGLYHATRVLEHMDADYKELNSVGTYIFNNNDYTTGVTLQINNIQGRGITSVEKHRYLPDSRSFVDTTFNVLLPYRFVINQYGIQSFSGKIKISVNSLPELCTPSKARLYWREKEGEGSFREITCQYNSYTNEIEANISKFGEFLIGVSNLPKPVLIYPNQQNTSIVSPTFEWQKVVGARSYQVAIYLDSNKTRKYFDTTLSQNNLFIGTLKHNTTYYWQVRAMNEKDTSQWSELIKFKTKIAHPTLVSPKNQSYGVGLTEKLCWSKVDGAESYKLEISDNVNFFHITHSFVGIQDTSIVVPGMRFNNRYFWRVYAISGLDTLLSYETFSFTTEMQKPELAFPENNSINVPLNSIIGWNLVNGAEAYIIEFDEDKKFNNPIIEMVKATQLSAEQLNYFTTYYWRVKAIRRTDSSQWSEIFSFTTELKHPELVYPANNASKIEVNPIFKWNGIDGDYRYNLQISRNLDFTNLVIDTIINQTYFAVQELKTNSNFYWRLRSIKNQYSSSWTNPFAFTTGNNFVLNEPLLVQPKNYSIIEDQVHFAWSPVIGAVKYLIQISTDKNFVNAVVNKEIKSTYFNFDIESYENDYYWRVKAYSIYDSSKWSDVWCVRPFNQNLKISLIYPKNFELQVKTTETLIWQQIDGVDYYLLEVATDKDFKNKIVDKLKLLTNNYTLTNLNKSTQYFWRVKISLKGRENAWSNAWTFTTETNKILPIPKIISPRNNFTGFDVLGRLDWEGVADAKSYRLVVSRDTSFDEIVVNVVTTNNYYILTEKLNYAERYYWKVSSISETSTSKWSNIASFKTELEPPKILYPIDSQTNLEKICRFLWSEPTEATYYSLQIARDENFKQIIYNFTELSSNNLIVQFNDDGIYYARIMAFNYENISKWSNPIKFTTLSSFQSVLGKDDFAVLPYPNPTKSILTIPNTMSQNAILIDLSGKTYMVKIQDNTIDMSAIPDGVYLLILENRLFKVIKQ